MIELKNDSWCYPTRPVNYYVKIFILIFLILVKAGVSVGDPVLRTGNPLSVELGPGKVDRNTLTPSQYGTCYP